MQLITSPFRIQPEAAVPPGSVERLYDRVFGPARFQKASHRLRKGVAPASALGWVATEGDRIIGAVRYWPIQVKETGEPALLLGPLAIAPEWTGRGIGTALVTKTLGLAEGHGHDLVLLAGDPAYYVRFGFVPASPCGFVMPGEARPERLQVMSLRYRLHRGRGGTLQAAMPDARSARAS
ncbi:MAG TPA: N-acetyltransferase [Dongiaceae bacterium]|nr:N-acetyltransferase [Dongiaceae bacterium]